MRAACFWSGWDNRSNIFFVMWIESVTIMILEISWRYAAWLILHLMVKNSASVLVMLAVWWSILIIGLLWTCMYAIEKAILFLTLAFITTSALDGVFDDSIAMLLSYWIWDLKRQSKFFLNKWKKKQLEKQSIILFSGLNSGLRGSKEGKTLLNWFSILTKWPLIRLHCCLVNKLSKSGWGGVDKSILFSMSDQRMWLSGRACCYGLKPLELDNRTTLVLSNTRELNRELFYKLVYLI